MNTTAASERSPGADPSLLLKPRKFGDIEPLSPFRFRSVPEIVLHRQIVVLLFACVLALVSVHLAMNYEPKPALALFFSVLGGVAVFFNPFFGVLAYYTFAFMRPQETFWGLGDTRLTFLVSAATVGAALIQFALKPSLEFLKSKQCFFVGLLWLIIYLSTHFGDFGGPEPKWMDYYNKLFLIYFVAMALLTSEKKLFALAWVMGLSIGYLGYWANEMYFVHGWHKVHGPGRPGATFYDENDFAMVIVMGVPFLWYLMRSTKNFILRLGLLALIPVCAHAVMLTFSRGGFLGLAASMAVVALRDRNRALGGFLIVCGLAFFTLFAGNEYKARINSINSYEEDRSATGRLESWEAGINMAVSNPFFGVGLKRYMTAFPYYSNFQPRVAHNSWVQLGAECGLVALTCYGLLIALTIRALVRIERRLPSLRTEHRDLTLQLARMIEATLVGYLVCGFFLSMEDFEFFYILVGMAQVLDRISETRLREAEAAEMMEEPGAGGGEVVATGAA